MNAATSNKRTATIADWVNIASGFWMAISPAVLGLSRFGTATWNNVVVGVALVLLNLALISGRGKASVPGLTAVLGIWLFVSAFVFGFLRAAFLWNNLIMAFVVMGGALVGDGLRSFK